MEMYTHVHAESKKQQQMQMRAWRVCMQERTLTKLRMGAPEVQSPVRDCDDQER